MSTVNEERRARPFENLPDVRWRELKHTYRCKAHVYAEDDGGYSAVAARLPGVVGQGESIEEALADLAESFRLALLEYLSSNDGIPWEDVEAEPGVIERWIIVNVS